MTFDNDRQHDALAVMGVSPYMKKYHLLVEGNDEDLNDEVMAGCLWEAISKFFSRNGLALEKFNVSDLEQYVEVVN